MSLATGSAGNTHLAAAGLLKPEVHPPEVGADVRRNRQDVLQAMYIGPFELVADLPVSESLQYVPQRRCMLLVGTVTMYPLAP